MENTYLSELDLQKRLVLSRSRAGNSHEIGSNGGNDLAEVRRPELKLSHRF